PWRAGAASGTPPPGAARSGRRGSPAWRRPLPAGGRRTGECCTGTGRRRAGQRGRGGPWTHPCAKETGSAVPRSEGGEVVRGRARRRPWTGVPPWTGPWREGGWLGSPFLPGRHPWRGQRTTDARYGRVRGEKMQGEVVVEDEAPGV